MSDLHLCMCNFVVTDGNLWLLSALSSLILVTVAAITFLRFVVVGPLQHVRVVIEVGVGALLTIVDRRESAIERRARRATLLHFVVVACCMPPIFNKTNKYDVYPPLCGDLLWRSSEILIFFA